MKRLISKLTCMAGHQFTDWQEYVRIHHGKVQNAKRRCVNCGHIDYQEESLIPYIERAETVLAERALYALNATKALRLAGLATIKETQKITLD